MKRRPRGAVRVARTGAAEIVAGVPSANASNGFLNVLLHAQALLAVPVVHGGRVQGVLVSVDAKTSSTTGEIWPISSAWAPVEAVMALDSLGSVAFMAKSALDGLDCQHTKNVGRFFATRMSDGRGDSEAINH